MNPAMPLMNSAYAFREYVDKDSEAELNLDIHAMLGSWYLV
jgi:hypothetical protein